jgi:hydroxymethylbilane synthase
VKIRAGARASPLSRAQFEEVRLESGLDLEPVWVETVGDLDQKTSLRTLGKSDFFTRELDEMLLAKTIRIAIHSAKDLPEPLPQGLSLVALTKGIDSRDSVVMREGESLRPGFVIATSSERREEAARLLCEGLEFIDLRGTIHKRLKLLETGEADGVVLAECALIRLQLTHLNRVYLPGDGAPLQGRLAVLARSDDDEMRRLFAPLSWP